MAPLLLSFPYLDMKTRPNRSKDDGGGFTLVEAVVAIVLVGIGITSTITALTKFNAFASVSRNYTGAYATVMNQIDAVESATPFNPQHQDANGGSDPQIPEQLKLDSARPGGLPLQENVSVYLYRDPVDPLANIIIVPGNRTTSVVDASVPNDPVTGATLYMRRVTVKVAYTYLSRPYSFSMSTLRASDQ